jgi:HlyD family secretion protein
MWAWCKAGQTASFTVSAYPARRYPATIKRVAFGSTKTDNVVTYTTTLTWTTAT